jgi:hypothetical protein
VLIYRIRPMGLALFLGWDIHGLWLEQLLEKAHLWTMRQLTGDGGPSAGT